MIILLGILNLVTFWLSKIDALGVIIPSTPLPLPTPVIIPNEVDVDSEGIHFVNSDDNITYGNPACANCTEYIRKNLKTALDLLASKIPSVVNTSEPCYKITYEGWNTIELEGDACLVPVENQPNLFDTIFYLIFGVTKFKTECIFNISNETPGDISSIINAAITNFTGTAAQNCVRTDAIEFAENNVEGSSNAILQTESPLGTVAKCTTLQSGSRVVMRQVNFTAEAYNITLQFVAERNISTKGPNGVRIKDIKVVNPNFKNTTLGCESDGTDNLCDCLIDSKVSANTVQNVATESITCYAKTEDKDVKLAVASYADCTQM